MEKLSLQSAFRVHRPSVFFMFIEIIGSGGLAFTIVKLMNCAHFLETINQSRLERYVGRSVRRMRQSDHTLRMRVGVVYAKGLFSKTVMVLYHN